MGLFGKIKNIFYDEEIVDVPEEPKSVEKPKIEEVKVEKKVEPIKRETPVINTTPTYSEREIFTRETTNTFKFPMLDEEEVKPVRTRVNALESARMEKKKEETEKARTDKYKDLFKENTTTSSKPDRIFKPSPVISPVYGVLDKNYTREEIIERQENITRTTNPKDMNYDAVRRKAYGTLEDDLEVIIPSDDYEITEETDIVRQDLEPEEDNLIDLDYQPRFAKKDDEVIDAEVVEEDNHEDLFEELETKEESSENNDMLNELKDETKSDTDELTDSDLFNLIDSMYDKKDDE